jgi:uncharacterized protein (DUF58 family)
VSAFAARLRAALLTRRPARQRGAGLASPRRSDGYEFAELRTYIDGDDPRRIDWAATARASELQTRVVLEDASLALAAAVDASPSMLVGRTQTNYAVACAAASSWYAAAVQDDRCYRVGASAVLAAPRARGRVAAAYCAAARELPGTQLRRELEVALALLPRDARLLVVSDFFELADATPALRACAARFDVTALVIGDPWGGALPLGGFVRLRDAASGTVARVYVDRRARARYRDAVERRERALQATLRDFGARTALLEADGEPERALATALDLA